MFLITLLMIQHFMSLRSLLTTALVCSGIGAALSVWSYYSGSRRRKMCFMYVAAVFRGAFYGWGAGFLVFFGSAGLYMPIHILRNSGMTVN